MAAVFNAGVDYFGLMSATSDALKIKSSEENKSLQTASGQNTEGDVAVVDSYGATAAPSAEYDVVAAISHNPTADSDPTTIFTLGSLIAAATAGTDNPLVLGSLTITTQTGSAPTVSASGQTVQSGASAALRTYVLPTITLSPRHRAQDFLGLCTIKKGVNAADPSVDYGLDSVSAIFPIEFTLAQPKGELANYDLHAGMATVDFSMNWYVHGGTPDTLTAPTIMCVSTLTLKVGTGTVTVPVTMTAPVSKSCPENGYVSYKWQASFPLIGKDA